VLAGLRLSAAQAAIALRVKPGNGVNFARRRWPC
jgi:hypothetical protein